MASKDDNTPGDQAIPGIQSARQGISRTMASPGAKFVLIGFITFILLIPAMMVWGLVEERSRRASEVATSISQGWGHDQVINGPYLIVPYTVTKGQGDEQTIRLSHAVISPEKLVVSGDVDVEERRLSIYKTQLYHTKLKMNGFFSGINLKKVTDRGGRPQLENAFLAMSVSDPTGFRSDVTLKIGNNVERQFLPGLNQLHQLSIPEAKSKTHKHNTANGVHFAIDRGDALSGFKFTINMALNGSRSLAFMPAGKTTSLDLKSNWPHPGFDGRFLPETREISETGFAASWTVPNLARGLDAVVLGSALPAPSTFMSVNFVEPLKFYQVIARTLKYSVAFFSLIFLAIFILELSGKRLIHWIQYMLSGLAMVIFYILLLALAEQVGFGLAYLISASATTLLIAWYIGDTLSSRRGSYVIGSVLGITYLIMYLILNEEQYALLAGSLIAFVAIAATMVATRRVDWSGRHALLRQASETG